MYKNVGREIKSNVKAYVIGSTVVSALVALMIIVIWYVLIWEYLFIAIVAAILVVIGGYYRARYRGMIDYAYGEITDRLISIDEKLLPKESSNHNSQNFAPPSPPQPSWKNVPPTPTARWTCVHCNHTNPGNVQLCELCHKLR